MKTGQKMGTSHYDAGDKMLTAGGKSFTYDLAGRTTQIYSLAAGTRNFVYDDEDRVVTSSGIGGPQSHSYNGLDTRISSTRLGQTTTFHRDGAYVTDPVIADSGATYTSGISERRGSETTFLHSGMKNAGLQTDASQAVSSTRKYDAFGSLISATGTWKGQFGYAGSFGYQEDDGGLKLLGHRYYDSTTGRFLTRYPIEDGRNWYTYCENDPINFFDNEGLESSAVVDFAAGWGDSLTFGATKIVRKYLGQILGVGDANQSVNSESGWYTAGEVVGTAHSIAIPASAGGRVGKGASEFSHFIPDRLIKRASARFPKYAAPIKKFGRSKLNGNRVKRSRHTRHDKYRNMKNQKRNQGKMKKGMRQLDRLPRIIGVPLSIVAQGTYHASND